MSSNYWVKLWIEILDDRKMAKLPDRAWRRCTELFLYAGELQLDGVLPSTDDIAWRLRCDEDELAEDLEILAESEIVMPYNEGWLVCKFSDRQSPMDAKERMSRMRNQKAAPGLEKAKRIAGSPPQTDSNGHSNDTVLRDVTTPVTNRNTDTDTDTDTEEKKKRAHARNSSSSGEEQKTTATQDELEQLAETIAKVTVTDLEACSEKRRAQIQEAAMFLSKKQVEPGSVIAFGEWWSLGDFPWPSQIKEYWLRFEESQERGTSQSSDHPTGYKPPKAGGLTHEQLKAAVAQMNAEQAARQATTPIRASNPPPDVMAQIRQATQRMVRQ